MVTTTYTSIEDFKDIAAPFVRVWLWEGGECVGEFEDAGDIPEKYDDEEIMRLDIIDGKFEVTI